MKQSQASSRVILVIALFVFIVIFVLYRLFGGSHHGTATSAGVTPQTQAVHPTYVQQPSAGVAQQNDNRYTNNPSAAQSIDTDALNSIAASASALPYASEVPDGDAENMRPASSQGKDVQAIPTYTKSNASEFQITKSSGYASSGSNDHLSGSDVAGWVPTLTGFANNFSRLFTQQQQGSWATRITPYLTSDLAGDVANAKNNNLPSGMPTKIEIIKTGPNYVTAHVSLNNGTVHTVAVIEQSGKWLVNYYN